MTTSFLLSSGVASLLLICSIVFDGAPKADGCTVDNGQLRRTFDRIREELPPGTVVGVLNLDFPSSVSSLQVVKDNRYFELNVSNHCIVVKESLDVDGYAGDYQSSSIQVRCVNRQGVAFDIELWFHVEDINDNHPIFAPSDSYTFNVSETAALSTEIGQVSARDEDRENGAIEYAIIEGENSAYFALRSKPGGGAALTLAVPLDYEKSQHMSVLISAMDCPHSGCLLPSDRKTATATVSVNIIDADDQNPEFMGIPYEAFLSDTAREGAVILQARARDLDTLNAPLRYEMSSSNDAAARTAYQIDSLTGVITVKNASFLQAGQLHLLQIRVYQLTDHSRRDSTTVVVRVVSREAGSADQQALQFDQRSYVVQVTETTLPGTAILTLAVNDLDPGRSLRFNVRGQPNEDMFKIVAKRYSTGVLYLKKFLDYETRTEYQFTIEVSDGKNLDTATVTVMVTDVNDNNPEFMQDLYEFRILMPATAAVGGTLCGSVVATDKDNKSNLTYKLGSSYRELFGITSSGSIVMTGGAADYRADVYYLTVLAIDDGSPPRTGMTTVTVYVARSSAAAFNSASKSAKADDEPDSYVIYIVAGIAVVLLAIVIGLVLYLARRKVKDAAKRMCTSPTGSTIAVEDGGRKPDKASLDVALKKPQGNGFAGQVMHTADLEKVDKQSIPLLPLNNGSDISSVPADRTATVKRNSYRLDSKPGESATSPVLDSYKPDPDQSTDTCSQPTYTMRSKSPNGMPYTSLVYTRNGKTGISMLYGEPHVQHLPAAAAAAAAAASTSTLPRPTCSDERSTARRKLLPTLSKGSSSEVEETPSISTGRHERDDDGDALCGLVPLDGTPTLPKRRITWDRTVYIADDNLEPHAARKSTLPTSPSTPVDDSNSLLMSPPSSVSSRQKLIINL